jgi:hypothetical protein
MATGDKPNSNLFGTDYNAEEEERKRLEAEASSAAQSAMMGAGGVPATAFGQAAASNLFQGATTFQDISEMQGGGQGGALNAEQGARDLRIGRQYESGGPVTLADMGSLMQAPQSAMMGAGVVSDLDSNILSQVPGIQNIRNPGAFDPANIEPARPIMSAGTAGRDERTTPREFASQSISSAVEGLRDVVGTESVSMEDYQAKQAKQAKQATQDAQGTLGVDQALQDSTGTSLSGTEEQQESPELEIRQGEEGSPQKAFNDIISERPLTPEEIRAGEAFADRRGFDFNPQTGFSTITDPGSKTFDTPATLENFRNRGLNLGQFMRYEDDPSQRTEQFVDPQGRLRRRLTPSAAALQGFEPGQQPLAPEFAEAEATGDQMIADLRAREAAERGEGKMSYTDAKIRARGQFAARNIDPSSSQLRDLARSIQAAEPERLEGLETEKAINEARIKTAEAELNRPEFKGRVYTVNGVTFAQTSRGGVQVISTGTEDPEAATAKMKDFEFTKKKIEEAREAYLAGDLTKANDILTAAKVQQYGIQANATQYFADSTPSGTGSGLTPQQEANITRQAFDTIEEAEAANLPKGTKITIGGRNATV